jgi:RNA polymerase sigma factor (sigma-70 family)
VIALRDVTPERTSQPAPITFEDVYRAYAVELRKWLRRWQLSPQDAEDAAQEIWLVIAAHPERLPTNTTDAQKELRRVASIIARTMQRRAMRTRIQHENACPDDLQGSVSDVEQFDNVTHLIGAIDQLDEPLREVFIASKVLEFSYPEIAAMTGVTERTVSKRVWNACAKVQKTLGQEQSREDKSNEKRGVVIAPTQIEIASETRATMCALWSIEGRMPQFGGPKDPPPPPPFPSFVKAAPILSEAARGVTLRVNQTILLILLLFTSAGTVALIWIWEPGKVNTARSGLRMPSEPIEEIPDVVDEYHGNTSPPVQSAQSAPVAPAKPLNSQERRSLRLRGSGHTRSGSE